MFCQSASCFTGQPVESRTPLRSISTTRGVAASGADERTGDRIACANEYVEPKHESDDSDA